MTTTSWDSIVSTSYVSPATTTTWGSVIQNPIQPDTIFEVRRLPHKRQRLPKGVSKKLPKKSPKVVPKEVPREATTLEVNPGVPLSSIGVSGTTLVAPETPFPPTVLVDECGNPTGITDVLPTTVSSIDPKKKRRRQTVYKANKECQFVAITAPKRTHCRLPTTVAEIPQCLVDCLYCAMPLDCRIYIAGCWHNMVLLSPIYRHGKLAWILLNRSNNLLYLSSHVTSDALHIINGLHANTRGIMEDNIWCRQGFNQICVVYKNRAEFDDHLGSRLRDILPPDILQIQPNTFSLDKVRHFLQHGDFLATFCHRNTRYEQYPLRVFAQDTRGWRVFGQSHPDTGICISATGKRCCVCPTTLETLRAELANGRLSTTNAASVMLYHTPTSIKPALSAQFQQFVTFVHLYPTTMFFP